MRLWHKDLISHLPGQQLRGQHRECCALRGRSWGKPHSTVNYVFTHPFSWLVGYHFLVMDEMKNRKYKPNEIWRNPFYRGKILGICLPVWKPEPAQDYPEHDADYLRECLDNLLGKGIDLTKEIER